MKIYLIWGAPKCGKTTLSKELAKQTKISYISVDSMESVLQYYLPAEEFSKNSLKWDNKKSNDDVYDENTAENIMKAYITQWQVSYKAIRSIGETTIIEGDSIIIEGYQVTPEIVYKIKEEFKDADIQEVFLIKTDKKEFLKNIHESITPNDWILKKTKNEWTFGKIADMLLLYWKYFQNEAIKYGLYSLNMDIDFPSKIESYINKK